MAIELRADEQQWLRYQPDEVVGTMRAAEAFSLRIAGAYLTRIAQTMPTDTAETLRHVGHILNKVSDARMHYLIGAEYDTPLESVVGAASFDVLRRFIHGEQVDPVVLFKASDAILAALTHIDVRGDGATGAGFLHPTRLESILLRGD